MMAIINTKTVHVTEPAAEFCYGRDFVMTR